MQQLIDNGFIFDIDSQRWWKDRVSISVCEMYATVYSDDVYSPTKALLGDGAENQTAIDIALEVTAERHQQTLVYAADVARVCGNNAFPVRYVQRAGEIEFFYNGYQTFITDPLLLFSLSMNRADEATFSTPECVVYAEDNPMDVELPEIFDVMHTETNYDSHCKEGVLTHNRVQTGSKTVVYSNMTNALAECLKYGVSNIGHQVAQIKVEDEHHTQLVMCVLRETKFPEVHAFAVTFLSESFNASSN
ncbi:MAG: hypothetical protein WC052_06170 [Patescibacteria group bacterium]